MEQSLPSLPSKGHILAIISAFFAATFILYGPSLTNEFVRWDDGMLIYENPAIREMTPRSLKHIFTTYDPELYIPLTFFTYQVDYQLGGGSPVPYHLGNLILHTLNALLGAWLIYLLSQRGWLALACGLIFALHPLHTEAVEWASARKDVLSTFFFLGSLIGYVYYRASEERRSYWLSIFLFFLGLLSKIMAVTLPVILLLFDVRERRRWNREMLMEKIPYFALALLFGIIGFFGKTAVVQSSTLEAKILMAAKSFVFYLEKIFLPFDLSLLYPYTKAITIASPDFYIPLSIVIVLAVVTVVTLRWTREVLLAIGFFAITVAPTFLNFAKGGETDVYFASDRYAYLPSLGIIYLAGYVIVRTMEWWKGRPERLVNGLVGTVTFALILALFSLSWKQAKVWANTEQLFFNVLENYPESSYVAHNNLGNVYRFQGDIDRAMEEYKKAVAIRPHVRPLSNLGAAYRKKGMFKEAHEALEQARILAPNNEIVYYSLGILYVAEGKASEAKKAYEKALELNPYYEEVHANLGSLALEQGNVDEAIEHFKQALAINNYLVEAAYNLGVAEARKGNMEGAETAYAYAVRLQPSFIQARINLGILYAERGRKGEAIAQFQAVLTVDPENADAKTALAQLGNL